MNDTRARSARVFIFPLGILFGMKWKNLTPEHYIRHMRRQSKHVQHMHAFIFAGAITTLIAAFILYTDYGFWHETYVSDDLVVEQADPSFNPESPGESIMSFFREAKERFSAIGSSSASLLEGKETYRR